AIPSSLHVHHLFCLERDLEVLVNVDLFGTEVHDFFRLSERCRYFIHRLSHLNGFRLFGWFICCLRSLSALGILIALRGATAVLLVATAVVDSKDLGDDIFYLRRTGLRQISFGKLEHNLKLVIRRRIDVITGQAMTLKAT